jgi:hypothetical protein
MQRGECGECSFTLQGGVQGARWCQGELGGAQGRGRPSIDRRCTCTCQGMRCVCGLSGVELCLTDGSPVVWLKAAPAVKAPAPAAADAERKKKEEEERKRKEAEEVRCFPVSMVPSSFFGDAL